MTRKVSDKWSVTNSKSVFMQVHFQDQLINMKLLSSILRTGPYPGCQSGFGQVLKKYPRVEP